MFAAEPGVSTDGLILVADFGGPETERYRVSDTVISEMRRALAGLPNIRIELLDQQLDERGGGSKEARRLGSELGASIIIWGWYGVTEESVLLSMNFEILQSGAGWVPLCPAAKGQLRHGSSESLESFSLQLDLSKELAFLSYVWLGLAHYSSGEWSAAVDSFNQALELSEEGVPSFAASTLKLLRAGAYYRLGRPLLAVSDSLDASRGYAVRANKSLGDLYRELEQFDLAVDYYSKALDGDQSRVSTDLLSLIFFGRSLAYESRGDVEEALSDFSLALDLSPDVVVLATLQGPTWLGLGNTPFSGNGSITLDRGEASVYSTQDLARRESELSKRIEVCASDPMARLVRGRIYDMLRKFDLALADYRSFLEERSEVGVLNYFVADYLLDSGDYSEARSFYDRAVDLGVGGSCIYSKRATVRMVLGDKLGAAEDLEAAFESSRRPGLLVHKAEVLMSVGNRPAAYKAISRAFSEGPVPKEGYLLRGKLREFEGDEVGALDDYLHAASLDPVPLTELRTKQAFRICSYLLLALALVWWTWTAAAGLQLWNLVQTVGKPRRRGYP